MSAPALTVRERPLTVLRCPVCGEAVQRAEAPACESCRAAWHPDCAEACPACSLSHLSAPAALQSALDELGERNAFRATDSDHRWPDVVYLPDQRQALLLREVEWDLVLRDVADGQDPLDAIREWGMAQGERAWSTLVDDLDDDGLHRLAEAVREELDANPLGLSDVSGSDEHTPAGTVRHVYDGQCHWWTADGEGWDETIAAAEQRFYRRLLAGYYAPDVYYGDPRDTSDAYSEACGDHSSDYSTIGGDDLAGAPDSVQLAVAAWYEDRLQLDHLSEDELRACHETARLWLPRGDRLRQAIGEALGEAVRA